MLTRDTFDKTFNSLGTCKAPGPDGIPNEIIKSGDPLRPLLSLLAHKSYTPPEWCHITTCPLHKNGDPILLDNCRPIALTNNLLKLWTALIKDAGSKYAETHGILPTFGWSNSHNRHTWDLLNQLRTLAATQLLYNNDVRQLYSKDFLFLEGTTDLDDEIQNMLRPTLDE
jgi:hypothetical protein